MSRMNVTIRSLVVLFAAGMIVPATAWAQGTSVKSAPARSPAEQLESFAFQPKTQTSDWIESAKALEQAAKLRPANDPVAVNNLIAAAGSYQMAGKPVQARWAAVDAAKRAFRIGDVYTAASAYVAAARLSIELRDGDGAAINLQHAQQLAESPKLTPEQKKSLFKQMGYPVDCFCKK